MTSRQLLVTADGLTHASSVIALVRCSEAASGIVTNALVPLNDNPPPYIPVVHVAPVMAPVFPLPDASATLIPVPSLNAYAATTPDVVWVPTAVTSLAESFDVLVSPPPLTVAVFVTLAGALLATFTVNVIVG